MAARSAVRHKDNHTRKALAVLLGFLLSACSCQLLVVDAAPLPQPDCSAEQQVVMCGQIPLEAVKDRHACCRIYRPQPALALVSVAGVDETTAFAGIARPDLAAAPPAIEQARETPSGEWLYGNCTRQLLVELPTFPAPRSAALPVNFTAPALNASLIRAVKARALEQLDEPLRMRIAALRFVNETSGFAHPGAHIGPAELALMEARLAAGHEVVLAARSSLLTGVGVKPKLYFPGLWSAPASCPADYAGPYVAREVDIKYNGLNGEAITCPDNYPPAAPAALCQHIAWVELDAQMVLKSALAWLATGDDRYANNAFRILDAWAASNVAWGRSDQNGPLEGGWGVAAMARGLEMLRSRAPPGLLDRFVGWVDRVIKPQIDNFLDTITPIAVARGGPMRNNWHSTIAEAEMAMGILTDNRTRYDRAVTVFNQTVGDYLRWANGLGEFTAPRIVGECAETMRDIYHTGFGLGGLLQMAEMAWQQDQELFSAHGHVLAAAMELHARIIRAAPTTLDNTTDADLLPAGFQLFSSMPPAPAGTVWYFNMTRQLWSAVNVTNRAVVSDLKDGIRYVVGNMFLPTGWEIGYNHFHGRLGLPMPETAALLRKYWPEAVSFHWGMGTLSHAGTAAELWRRGIEESVLCAPPSPTSPLPPPSVETPALPPSLNSTAPSNGTTTPGDDAAPAPLPPAPEAGNATRNGTMSGGGPERSLNLPVEPTPAPGVHIAGSSGSETAAR